MKREIFQRDSLSPLLFVCFEYGTSVGDTSKGKSKLQIGK